MYRIDIEWDIFAFRLIRFPSRWIVWHRYVFRSAPAAQNEDSGMNRMNVFCAVDFRDCTIAISIMLVILLNSMKPAGKRRSQTLEACT